MDLHCIDEGGDGDGDDGESEPLLFVHGWTCDASDFLSQVAFFRRTHRVTAEFPAWEGPSTPASIREKHIRRMLAMNPAVVSETFRHLFGRGDSLAFREHTQPYFTRRTCPVLAIYGRDGLERVEWEALHSRNPASRFLHLPLGHWLQEDAPDLVNQLIGDWLSTLQHTTEGEDIRGVISETGSCGK